MGQDMREFAEWEQRELVRKERDALRVRVDDLENIAQAAEDMRDVSDARLAAIYEILGGMGCESVEDAARRVMNQKGAVVDAEEWTKPQLRREIERLEGCLRRARWLLGEGGE